jgi:hypothetical protein
MDEFILPLPFFYSGPQWIEWCGKPTLKKSGEPIQLLILFNYRNTQRKVFNLSIGDPLQLTHKIIVYNNIHIET